MIMLLHRPQGEAGLEGFGELSDLCFWTKTTFLFQKNIMTSSPARRAVCSEGRLSEWFSK